MILSCQPVGRDCQILRRVVPLLPYIAVKLPAASCGAFNGIITAYEENIPIVTVILNNQALGWVHHVQGGRTIASRFKDVDYAGMAKAAGCAGHHVETPGQFRHALLEALKNQEPAVLDVRVSLETTFRDVTSPLAIG